MVGAGADGAHHLSRCARSSASRRRAGATTAWTARRRAYEAFLADDLNGPAEGRRRARRLCGGAEAQVLDLGGSSAAAGVLARYLRYRLLYNMRLLRTQAGKRTQKPYHQKPLR